jgi:hypothetical protein
VTGSAAATARRWWERPTQQDLADVHHALRMLCQHPATGDAEKDRLTRMADELWERHFVVAGSASPDEREDVKALFADAFRFAYEGRASHVKWAEHLEAHADGGCDECTQEVVETAGDVAHQREWVQKYDRIIEALQVNATPFLLEGIAKISDEVAREQSVRLARHALRLRAHAEYLHIRMLVAVSFFTAEQYDTFVEHVAELDRRQKDAE